jgi:hypothetical protein
MRVDLKEPLSDMLEGKTGTNGMYLDILVEFELDPLSADSRSDNVSFLNLDILRL